MGQHSKPIPCPDHKPRQHRDGKPPWCERCRLTADGTEPVGRFGSKLPPVSYRGRGG